MIQWNRKMLIFKFKVNRWEKFSVTFPLAPNNFLVAFSPLVITLLFAVVPPQLTFPDTISQYHECDVFTVKKVIISRSRTVLILAKYLKCQNSKCCLVWASKICCRRTIWKLYKGLRNLVSYMWVSSESPLNGKWVYVFVLFRRFFFIGRSVAHGD